MRVTATVCLVTLVVSLCEGIVVFPDTVAELGLLPFPLYFMGMPIQVAGMFLGFFGAIFVGTWAAKGRLHDYTYYYDGFFDVPDEDVPGYVSSRTGKELRSEAAVRHAMTKILKQLDVENCLLKLVCHLEELSGLSPEEELLLRLFPATDCAKSSFSRCVAKEEDLRRMLEYYQRMEKKTLDALKERES